MIPDHKVTHASALLPYLFEAYKDLKKTKIKQLLKHGSVCVNGHRITAHDHKLQPGDRLSFLTKQSTELLHKRSELSFPIIFEDDDMIVIDKPEGLLTMGTEKEKVHTAYYELMDYVKSQKSKLHPRIYIVHRLDKDASGVMVFAKNEKSKEYLQSNWNEFTKKYYALVQGIPAQSEGKIESYLVEDNFRRVYSIYSQARDAKHAVTHYRVAESANGFSILDVTLITGRKNQIRVHLSDLGHPILGDAKYGSESDAAGRLGLHSYMLAIKHPVSGEMMIFESPLPKLLSNLVRERNPEQFPKKIPSRSFQKQSKKSRKQFEG